MSKPSKRAGAPVRITPAMIRSGVFAYEQFRESGLTPDVLVREVFRAMMEARSDKGAAVRKLAARET